MMILWRSDQKKTQYPHYFSNSPGAQIVDCSAHSTLFATLKIHFASLDTFGIFEK
jgi:hypothetical protein